MSQDQTSSILASLLLAQAGLQVSEQHATRMSLQPQFAIQKHSREYLSPYATSNVESTVPLLASSQQHEPPRCAPNPVFAEKVNEVIARAKANGGQEVMRGSLEWEAAREAVLADMQLPVNTDSFAFTNHIDDNLHMEARTGGRRGRGPRRRGSPIAVGTIKLEANAATLSGTPQSGKVGGRSRGGRGGRPRGSKGSRGARGSMRNGKRKRSGDEDEDGDGNEDTDSSENFTPLPTQSRSGRKIFQANSNPPIIKIDDDFVVDASPSSKTQRSLSGSGKKSKGNYRRPPGANALCKNCGRGHSPLRNVIVFCDGCNTPWHQYCHDPPIKGEVVQIEETEWFCADCAILREEKQWLNGTVAGDGMSLTEVCKPWPIPVNGTNNQFRNENTSRHFPKNILSLSFYTPAPFTPLFLSLRPRLHRILSPQSLQTNQHTSLRPLILLEWHWRSQKNITTMKTFSHIRNPVTGSRFGRSARIWHYYLTTTLSHLATRGLRILI